MSDLKKYSLTTRVIIGMVLGIILGLTLNIAGLNSENSFINTYIVDGAFQVIGKMFINALKMLVVPLVFFSLICGVCGIGNIKSLGRVGTKSFALYMLTTALAITLAISISLALGIGQGMNLSSTAEFTTKEAPALTQVLINIIPDNPIKVMANGDMLPLIFFSILVGISILSVGKRAEGLVVNIQLVNDVMMQMVTIVMSAAPYAVFALIAQSMANLGIELLLQLTGYVFALLSVLLLHLFGTLMLLLKVATHLSPRTFLKKMRTPQVFAFSTASSNATIPITLKTVTDRLGVNNAIGSFSVPFGATINMDGTAIMQGVATVFIAHIYNVDLSLVDYITVVLMSVLASIGTAGVPGVGLIMLSMVFVQVGLPIEGIGLILGVDRLMDMIRTVINVSGDAVVSIIVAKSEQKLNTNIYNAE
jgi:Na+/H+-dicarboxylate symporter